MSDQETIERISARCDSFFKILEVVEPNDETRALLLSELVFRAVAYLEGAA